MYYRRKTCGKCSSSHLLLSSPSHSEGCECRNFLPQIFVLTTSQGCSCCPEGAPSAPVLSLQTLDFVLHKSTWATAWWSSSQGNVSCEWKQALPVHLCFPTPSFSSSPVCCKCLLSDKWSMFPSPSDFMVLKEAFRWEWFMKSTRAEPGVKQMCFKSNLKVIDVTITLQRLWFDNNWTEMQVPLLGALFLKYPGNNYFHILGVYCN